MNRFNSHAPVDPARRRFVEGLALGGAVATLGLHARAATGQMPRAQNAAVDGTAFDLDIGETWVNLTGTPRPATTVNGRMPAPTLRWREGETVTLRINNRLRVPTSIHWHGIVLPYRMDGVPGISFAGIAPGESFVYRFPVVQSGTYWYHSHSGFQEQTGLYGALIVTPRDGRERFPADREHVVLLSDWTDEDPARIYAKLKKQSDLYNFAQPTAVDFFRDAGQRGLREAMAARRMWNAMRMNPTDLGDVSGATYTYLVNGLAPGANWTGFFERGERVRLRIVNGASSTIFDLRIPGLAMTVVAADGQDIEPVTVDELRISAAETYDVIVEPHDDRAYTIFAQSIDRSGYARGTLAPRLGLTADVPAIDPRVWLGPRDMMGAMAMDGGSGAKAMDHATMPGMAHASMPAESPKAINHARTEYGPNVDMHVDMPRTNLDDPGIGLRDNGRRVLTYADLHTIGGSLDAREPARDIELHLTGHMERFVWSFDGVKYSDAAPVHFRLGERVRLVLVNDTMMNHPIHLHGMFGELETADGAFQVRKHTINVQPAQRIAYGVTADAVGRWAYHCHLLYHMEAGMFREVVVS